MLQTEVKFVPESRAAVTGEAAYGLDSYVNGYLNAHEKNLYNSNKTKALLCLANGKLALDYSKKHYNNNVLHNGNGDAFRHSLWTFGMTRDVGADFAKKWSDAHETGAAKQPALEKSMDLHNNSVGINLGKTNTQFMSHNAMIDLVKKQVRSGKLKVISNNKLVASSSSGEK